MHARYGHWAALATLVFASRISAQPAPEPQPPAPASSARLPDAAPAPPPTAPTAPAPAPTPAPTTTAPPAPPPAPPGYVPPIMPAYAPATAPPGAAPAKPVTSAYRHDGFFLRLGMGVGWFKDDGEQAIDTELFNARIEYDVSGAALSGEFLIGGTVAPGLVVGGGTMGAYVPNPTLEVDGQESETQPDSLNLSLLGAFLAYYPNPEDGLHVLGYLGYARMHWNFEDESDEPDDPSGFGFAMGVGYEWWIGEQWSLGITGKMIFASLQSDDAFDEQSATVDLSDDVVLPVVLVHATYH